MRKKESQINRVSLECHQVKQQQLAEAKKLKKEEIVGLEEHSNFEEMVEKLYRLEEVVKQSLMTLEQKEKDY